MGNTGHVSCPVWMLKELSITYEYKIIKDYRTQFIQELSAIYDIGEAESFFYLILEEKQ